MADNRPILVTGAAGQLGAVGRTVVGLLLERGLPVRGLARREDERAAALRAAGAEVVVGDLLEPADVSRVVLGCRRVYFSMYVSASYLEGSDTLPRPRRCLSGRPGLSPSLFQHVRVRQLSGGDRDHGSGRQGNRRGGS